MNRNVLLSAVVAIALSGVAGYLPAQQKADHSDINALVGKGQYQQALDSIASQLEQEGSDRSGLQLLRGAVLVRMGKLDEAMSQFQSLAESNPNDAAIFNNMGVIYAERGNLEEARKSFATALKISPKYQQAAYNLGDVYTELACRSYARIENPAPGSIPALCKSPQKEKPASGNDPVVQEIAMTLDQWEAAWESKDVQKYLAFYDPAYAPVGASHESWADKRSKALSKPAWIKIERSNLEVAVKGDSAKARFVQAYQSDRYADKMRKELTLKRDSNGWRIVAEGSL